MKAIINSYEEFNKALTNALWTYAGVIRSSQYANATHHSKMFEAMPKNEAVVLLNSAEFHEEFHPDCIKLINKKLAAL